MFNNGILLHWLQHRGIGLGLGLVTVVVRIDRFHHSIWHMRVDRRF